MRLAVNALFLSEKHSGFASYVRGMIPFLAAPHDGDEMLLYSALPGWVSSCPSILWKRSPVFLQDKYGTAGHMARFFWMQTILPLLLLKEKAEVFFSPVTEGMIRPTARQVVVVHDLIPLFYPEECPRLSIFYRRILPLVLSNTSIVIADSFQTKRDLVRCFRMPEEKVAVVYCGLDPLYFSSEPGECPPEFNSLDYFLFVGTYAPRKNLATVVRAFARIHRELPHELVIVAYRDRFTREILLLARDLGVLSKLRFFSGLPSRQLLYLYRNATALLLLSEYEGFGYPPLEAMACHTPAIVSDATSLAEITGGVSICLPPNDVAGVASAMQDLAEHPDRRRALGERSAGYAGKFAWEDAAQSIREIIQRCGES